MPMRVIIQPTGENKRAVMVVPMRATHLAPIYMRDLTKENLREQVGPVIAAVDKEEREHTGRRGQGPG
jgi:hypothetical protein